MVINSLKLCAVHGTTRHFAGLIVRNGFKPGDSGYLGSAVYFFPCTQEGRNAAMRWSDEGVSVSARIEVPTSHFLDITSKDTVNEICELHHSIVGRFASDLVVLHMKKFLHKICKRMAEKNEIDYNECVIHSIFPAIDGKNVERSMKMYVVKGHLAKITVCQVHNAAGMGVANV